MTTSRYCYYKKPRRARRLRRRYAKWWNALPPELQALMIEMREMLQDEIDRQILYGEGRPIVLEGIE